MAKDKLPANVAILIKTPLTEEEYAALKSFLEGKDLEIEGFKGEIGGLNTKIQVITNERDTLKSEVEKKGKLIIELEKEVNDLNQLKADHIAEIQAKDKITDALSNEIMALRSEKDDAPAVPTVKVGKKTYIIVIPKFHYDGKDRTAAEVKSDPELAAKLVAEKSGVLVESV